MSAQQTSVAFHVGGKYNWRNQPERLVYLGSRHYSGDRRRWHQFAKVEAPSVVWSEVLDEDLSHFEATEGPAPCAHGIAPAGGIGGEKP